MADSPQTPPESTVNTPPGMVLIPAGEVTLGSAIEVDENPVRTVRIAPFFLDVHPVTNAQYAEFVAATGHRTPKQWTGGVPPPGEESRPVVWLSWFDASAYAAWAGKRLPTEVEWEKAARGTMGEDSNGDGVGDGYKYPWGTQWNGTRCNTDDETAYDGHIDGAAGTAPVGTYPEGASIYGLHDMAGNVWEWCADVYAPYRSPHAPPDTGDLRVRRGGSWYSTFEDARTAHRDSYTPEFSISTYGFRCAADSLPK